DQSTSDTIPYNEILNNNVALEHEASVSKISEDQLFYLMSRGISEEDATAMIINGFMDPITKELPMEYAVEMNQLINMSMEGSVG
ncbi:MAG: SufD family Fe-S cluster assembly protein, partial [Tetragenococcus halophilus]|nr:SufD family Fe-S cluster assembly protein [Tetragenococcus halophilus]